MMLPNDVRCSECELGRKGNQCKAMIKLEIDNEINGELNLRMLHRKRRLRWQR